MVSISTGQLLLWWYLLVGFCVAIKLAFGVWRRPPRQMLKALLHPNVSIITLICIAVAVPQAHASYFVQLESGWSLPLYIFLAYLGTSTLTWLLYGSGRIVLLWVLSSMASTGLIIWCMYEYYQECTASGWMLFPTVIWQGFCTVLLYHMLIMNSPVYEEYSDEDEYEENRYYRSNMRLGAKTMNTERKNEKKEITQINMKV